MKKDRYTLRIIYAILLYIIIFTGCSSNGKTQLETSIESKTHLIASEITAKSIQQSSEPETENTKTVPPEIIYIN
ncbi:hypothetical protein D3Z47_05095 [Lachnospiraceae bacterium]|nr:hypothetical protein [Lachnospiraceae bacterium]